MPFPGVLVELIVVLVILAILAAMMVPALLGYIDEARNKEYVLQARSIYMAAQAVADEQYAKSKATLTKTDLGGAFKEISRLADVELTDATWLKDATVEGAATEDDKTKPFKIKELYIVFPSKDASQYVHAVLSGGEWNVTLGSAGESPSGLETELKGTAMTERIVSESL